MALMDIEGRERLRIDRDNLNEFARSIRGIHKMELEQLMINYICDNDIKNQDIDIIRYFVKYLKEQ